MRARVLALRFSGGEKQVPPCRAGQQPLGKQDLFLKAGKLFLQILPFSSNS